VATLKQAFGPKDALLPASAYATYRITAGTNYPVEALAFDASTEWACYFQLPALGYGSGNVTVRIQWYADTASSGGVAFGCSLAAITPNTDSQDVETNAFATENTGSDSHLGTTGQRLHEMTVTVSNLDSLAAGDTVWLKLARKVADASDTMTGAALVTGIQIEYSDT